MHSPVLEHFIAQAIERSRALADPADCVLAIAPLMLDLLREAHTFLEPQHFRSDPAHYARNLVRGRRHPPSCRTRAQRQLIRVAVVPGLHA